MLGWLVWGTFCFPLWVFFLKKVDGIGGTDMGTEGEHAVLGFERHGVHTVLHLWASRALWFRIGSRWDQLWIAPPVPSWYARLLFLHAIVSWMWRVSRPPGHLVKPPVWKPWVPESLCGEEEPQWFPGPQHGTQTDFTGFRHWKVRYYLSRHSLWWAIRISRA